jgi:hypothetical protein
MNQRSLRHEKMESRTTMASDLSHNFVFPQDTNDDGTLSSLDALVVINSLNRTSRGGTMAESELRFCDADDDSLLTALDALVVINALNQKGSGSQSQAQTTTTITGARIRVELETEGTETELKIQIDGAPADSKYDVSLAGIALGELVTNSRGRGRIVLSRGDDNREHLPLPKELTTLSPSMELVIGGLVQGPLSQLARIETQTNLNDDSRSDDRGNSDNDDDERDDRDNDDHNQRGKRRGAR